MPLYSLPQVRQTFFGMGRSSSSDVAMRRTSCPSYSASHASNVFSPTIHSPLPASRRSRPSTTLEPSSYAPEARSRMLALRCAGIAPPSPHRRRLSQERPIDTVRHRPVDASWDPMRAYRDIGINQRRAPPGVLRSRASPGSDPNHEQPSCSA